MLYFKNFLKSKPSGWVLELKDECEYKCQGIGTENQSHASNLDLNKYI